MIVFIDTSGFLSVMDKGDENHNSAKKAWYSLINEDHTLLTTNYVLVETIALCQHRFGIESVTTFQNDIYPLLRVEWIKSTTHLKAIDKVLSFSRCQLSFVDCTSFEVMRSIGIESAFCFDKHFIEQGFMMFAK